MKTVSRLLAKLGIPPWTALLAMSAILFLLGSASFSADGAQSLAQVGVFGAVAAVAVIAALLET